MGSCPNTHRISLAKMNLNRWYPTSTITVTVPSTTHPPAVNAQALLRGDGESGDGEPMDPG